VSNQEESRQGEGGNGAPAEPDAGVADPEDRVAAIEAERDEMKDRMLRVAAEFDNWKKRARKDQDEGEAKARESVLRDMLDVMDNLERAVSAYGTGGAPTQPGASAADAQAVLKGVGLVLRLFQSKLDRYGIKPIEARGQPFDPRLHEAISRVETTDVPAGHVAVEMQPGYRVGDRLLRPSMVGVAVTPAQPSGGKRKGQGGANGAANDGVDDGAGGDGAGDEGEGA
jgi:molecular chaperone GrpE